MFGNKGIIKIIFLLAFAAPVFTEIFAQKDHKLELIQDERIQLLIARHIDLNRSLPGVDEGYRIQIFFDSGAESKKRAQDVRTGFLQYFPDLPAYLTFQEPFFKIRVGDFRTKLEAEGILMKLKDTYPNAFTVKDRINFPILK